MKSLTVAVAVVVLALISFYQFPGHAWLQQDTQIYVPILEHLRDPSVLRGDLLVERPHVSFTLYDEFALALQRITGGDFRTVLGAEQIVTRALGIWGVYLLATAAGLALGPALLVASIYTLGAAVPGPMVLTMEYEPVPRAFAVPLLLCAAGLIACRRYGAGGVAAALAFLIHPPTVYPVWALYFLLALWPDKPSAMRARIWGLFPLLASTVILAVASRWQAGVGETQVFFSRLAPAQEQLQHLRAGYVWISVWWRLLLPYYVVLCAVFALAWTRIRDKAGRDLRVLLSGLVFLGMLSMPVSWLLLEHAGWALIPQFQPMRALLFVVFAAEFAAAVAGVRAVERRRPAEALAWFAAGYLVASGAFNGLPPARMAAVAILAALATATLMFNRMRSVPAALVASLAGFWILPAIGDIPTPAPNSPDVLALSRWARQNTAPDAVFLFPAAGRQLYPGIFRSEALRPVYVDWKGGGQVNYLKDLGEQWWERWRKTMAPGFQPQLIPEYRALGISYIVLPRSLAPPPHAQPVFANAGFAAYRIR